MKRKCFHHIYRKYGYFHLVFNLGTQLFRMVDFFLLVSLAIYVSEKIVPELIGQRIINHCNIFALTYFNQIRYKKVILSTCKKIKFNLFQVLENTRGYLLGFSLARKWKLGNHVIARFESKIQDSKFAFGSKRS